MVAEAGTFKDGELWLRCPYCGDSTKHPTRAHYSVNTEGYEHCLRCKAGGRITTAELIKLIVEHTGKEVVEIKRKENWKSVYHKFESGAGSPRRSGLVRYHLTTERGIFDCFIIRNGRGKTVGVQLCSVRTKSKRIYGTRGISYRGKRIISSLSRPIILVEGPYDVWDEHHICAFGLPGPSTYRMLRGQFVILCPDGDVWKEKGLCKQFLYHSQKAYEKGGVFILGVQILDRDKDPEEVAPKDREFVDIEEYMKWRF